MNFSLLNTLFPFYLAMNRRMEIFSLGSSLHKLDLGIVPGHKFSDHFFIQSPPVDLSLEAVLEQSSTVFFVSDLKESVSLKGQMVPLTDQVEPVPSSVLFLGSPVLQSLDDIKGLGLTLKDFALHDAAADYLILMHTQARVLKDTSEMAQQLQQEIAVRRKAQEDLKAINLSLEDTVRERTLELQESNVRLAGTVEQLEYFNSELYRLNTIGEHLHSCQTVHEAMPVIVEGIEKLFPGSSGRLTLYDHSRAAFDKGMCWGGQRPCPGPEFSVQDCSALKVGRMLCSEPGCKSCPRHETESGQAVLCRPLNVGDSLMGLLQIWYQLSGDREAYSNQAEWSKSRRMLAMTLSEHAALALSNLGMKERLEAQAIRDPLTGLFNRRHMESFLEREMDRIKRKGGMSGLILLDVDHFKLFNDTHGHQAGDDVLVQLGGLLEKQIRKGDIACRFGGEEFLLILNDASLKQTRIRAEGLRQSLAKTSFLSSQGKDLGKVTISMGVAGIPEHGTSVEAVFNKVDKALYQAKNLGRNRVMEAK